MKQMKKMKQMKQMKINYNLKYYIYNEFES
jgi:hypothetical protein